MPLPGDFVSHTRRDTIFHRIPFKLKEVYMEFPFTIHNWLYLILSVVGLFVLGSALRSKRLANASQNWQGTQGRVVDSRVDKRSSTDSDGHTSTSYEAIVLYKYSAMGKDYTGDRVAFGVKNTNPGPANEVIKRYPVDTQVMVYYNPAKPAEAVLERSSNSGWMQILIGVALFIAGIYFAIK
jgi:hypothetical protein